MGGFAVELPCDTEFAWPWRSKRGVISPDGLLWMFQEDQSIIPDLSSDAIKDKSKSDSFSKTIVLIQGK